MINANRAFTLLGFALCRTTRAIILAMTALCASFVFAADRGAAADINCVYPSGTLVQNGGRILNVKKPPAGVMAANGNGSTNDTEALQSAWNFVLDKFNERNSMSNTIPYMIYFPNGIYRVTDIVFYTDDLAAYHDITKVQLVGQSRSGTIIRLDDNSSGFDGADVPKPVMAFQGEERVFNNWGARNVCQNMTIDVGSGNPRAAGLRFQGANTARLSNVTIKSEKGDGYAGLWIPNGAIQAYCKDLTVEGFDYGILSGEVFDPQKYKTGEMHTTFEHVTLKDQNIAGILIRYGGTSIRDLFSDQGANHVPAILTAKKGSQVVLIESKLVGGSSTHPAIHIHREDNEALFARNVNVEGYTVSVEQPGKSDVIGDISEYVNYPVTTLFDGQRPRSFNLPVEDTPFIPWVDDLAEWVNVDDHGADGWDDADDQFAIQAAFDYAESNGKSVIYFPGEKYKMSGKIDIPAEIKRVDFLYCRILGGSGFRVNESSSDPITFRGKGGPGGGFTINAQRDVIGIMTQNNYHNTQTSPIRLYLESCGNVGGDGQNFCNEYVTVWARSLNNERTSGVNFFCDGGTMWVLGWKVESKPATMFKAQNGGTIEALGGYANETIDPGDTFLLVNDNSNMSIVAYTSFWSRFDNTVQEIRDGVTKEATYDVFPLRGWNRDNDYFVPLYVGGSAGPDDTFIEAEDGIVSMEAEHTTRNVSGAGACGGMLLTYTVAPRSRVSLDVYSLAGRRVARLVDGERQAGTHSLRIERDDGTKLHAGTYVICLKAGSEVVTRKMTLVR